MYDEHIDQHALWHDWAEYTISQNGFTNQTGQDGWLNRSALSIFALACTLCDFIHNSIALILFGKFQLIN